MGVKRTNAEIERDKVFITEKYLAGHSYRAIAKLIEEDKSRKYTITFQQIGTEIKAMLDSWREQREENIDEWVATELAKIDRLEVIYNEAWLKSVKDFTKVKVKTGKNSFGDYSEEVMEDMRIMGDPRFLQGIERCIQKRCDLLGLDKPKEINLKTMLDYTEFTYEKHPALKAV